MSDIEIAALPIAEKLRLMETLWDSLCRQSSDGPEIPGWHEDILAERMGRLDRGEEPVSPWSEAKQRIRKQTEPK